MDKLLALGRPDFPEGDLEYASLGIGPEHVPELLRLLQDKELLSLPEEADEDDPRWYAHIHAWRALSQLHAQEAIEPLLDMMAENAVAEDWSDWILEELPETIARIGPQALPAVLGRLKQQTPHGDVSRELASVLERVALRHPETRTEAVNELSRLLDTASTNDPAANGFIVGNLLDLKAVEAWPVIERAYQTGNVDETICGDLPTVKWQLGLGPKPESQIRTERRMAQFAPRTNAKQRFNERQRQKKLAKKQKKKKR